MNVSGRNGGNAWTSEQVDELKRLVSEGFSGGEIERATGGIHSRNSIIGKIHRLGLQLARLPTQSNTARPGPRPRAQKPSVPGSRNGGDPIAPTPLNEHAPAQGSVPMLLLDAGSCNCRWDIGRKAPGEPLICGAPTHVYGESWCSHHRDIIRGRGTHSERNAAKAARAA